MWGEDSWSRPDPMDKLGHLAEIIIAGQCHSCGVFGTIFGKPYIVTVAHGLTDHPFMVRPQKAKAFIPEIGRVVVMSDIDVALIPLTEKEAQAHVFFQLRRIDLFDYLGQNVKQLTGLSGGVGLWFVSTITADEIILDSRRRPKNEDNGLPILSMQKHFLLGINVRKPATLPPVVGTKSFTELLATTLGDASLEQLQLVMDVRRLETKREPTVICVNAILSRMDDAKDLVVVVEAKAHPPLPPSPPSPPPPPLPTLTTLRPFRAFCGECGTARFAKTSRFCGECGQEF